MGAINVIHQTNIYQIEYEKYLFFRRIKIFLISFLLCFAAALFMKVLTRGVSNPIFDYGDFIYYRIGNSALVIGYNGSGGEVVIPVKASYDGVEEVDVTGIDYHTFKDNTDITSVTGDSITTIGSGEFQNCTNLVTANFPKATNVAEGAFDGCNSLTNYTEGDFTYEVENINNTAKLVKYNGNATEVNIPERIAGKRYAVTAIGNQAFKDNTNIKSVTGNSIRKIEHGYVYSGNGWSSSCAAFDSCVNLEKLILPKATSIGEYAFQRCTALTTITLPKAAYIEDYAFLYCSALETIIHITNSTEFEYNGEKQKPTFEIKNVVKNGESYTAGDTIFQEGTDYELIYGSDSDSDSYLINAGKKSVTIEFKGNNLGGLESVTVDFEIKPTDISDLTVDVEDHTYDGKKWEPEFKFRKEGNYYDLVKDTDYTVEFPEDMTNAGDKTVTIKASENNYTGSQTKTFKIIPKDISGLTVEVEGETEHTYDGKEWNPEFVIKDGETKLEIDKDYTAQFDQNMKDIGKKNVKIKYIGNYTGEKDIQLEITPKNASGFEPNYEQTHVYNGNNWNPEFVIKDGETKLEIDKDYIVQFDQNMKDVGTKNVKIKYIGNYTGEKDIQLEITPKNASGFEPNYEQIHVYNGNNWNPEFAIKDGETKLEIDKDYIVQFDQNMKDIGKKNVKIKYIGNYTGEKDVKLRIVVDKSNWGEVNKELQEKYGIINYVDNEGKTSAEVTGNEMIWLKESSDGTSAWYAIDNTNGTFKQGSRFWVQWLSPEANKEKFDEYYNKLDDEHKRQVENNKLWIFLTGVTDPDGNDYTNLERNVNYYIQLGEDWDEYDVKAVFISDKNDDVLQILFEDVNTPEETYKCAKILMQHFSPYAVYDPIDSPVPVPDAVPDDQKNEPETDNNEKNEEPKEEPKNDNNENLIPKNNDKNSNNGKNFLINPTKENFDQAINSGLIAKISVLIFLILIPSVLIFNKLKRKSKINKD